MQVGTVTIGRYVTLENVALRRTETSYFKQVNLPHQKIFAQGKS